MRLVNNPKKPTFGSVMIVARMPGELLNRISFGHFLQPARSHNAGRNVEIARCAAQIIGAFNDLSLNPELFARGKYAFITSGTPLQKEDKSCTEDTYQGFHAQRCGPVRRR